MAKDDDLSRFMFASNDGVLVGRVLQGMSAEDKQTGRGRGATDCEH